MLLNIIFLDLNSCVFAIMKNVSISTLLLEELVKEENLKVIPDMWLFLIRKKKTYDSVPIFNILTKKIFHLSICDKCFDFTSNLYLTSKAKARYLDML